MISRGYAVIVVDLRKQGGSTLFESRIIFGVWCCTENSIKLNCGGDEVNMIAQGLGNTVLVTRKMRLLSFNMFVYLKALEFRKPLTGDAGIDSLYFVWSRDSASAIVELNRIQLEPPETAIRSSEIP
jgi:hypothetical protein